ncbi:MAG: tetratricopeptide repeat protein [Candidatus Obscuribacter sp.]|jgi:Tfp pilus assembly protein PilF|nr:tetratricopeptide repeat protein [Candidatus Obscuribacter sp.]MDQ5966828.1 Tetratricopeptide repeat protein [Cyanobacteriota bacterium erpe_2018_sw_39hr_WHONDRS-SW48-000098_B_bin.30]MBK7837585.1 tetratricopeptide repeat protein [Candidatus Obscuribacter sp.]MBK9206403.1 tetratricopeptide repeat protein [Candidatus Obscuribacter sp.]MBK9618299.1 tetratricopeptide repeat protein [Candidatus Obscuribacter sp.]
MSIRHKTEESCATPQIYRSLSLFLVFALTFSCNSQAQAQTSETKPTEVKADTTHSLKPVNEKILPLINAGYEQIGKGQYDKAVQTLEKAVKADKESVSARRYLAFAQVMQGNNLDALKSMQVLSKMVTPRSLDWYIFGQAYLGAGGPKHAKACFTQALTYSPDYDAARGGLIRALVATGDYDGAVSAVQEGLGKSKSPDVKKYYATMYSLVMAQKQASENSNISTPTETSSPQQSEDEGPILIKPTNGG